jgi:predicted dehydrogenase
MTPKEIHVGIVGANTKASWAAASHLPTINGLSGLTLAAVATRNEQSAREAARTFGADRWFSDPFAMIRDDRIDVITIAVKVPAHRDLVLAALEAGKAVYCEAPLGRTVAEAEEMASAAASNRTAIGLQGRLNPAARRAAELVSSGRIGRPLNARIVSTSVGFGPELPSSHDYFNRASFEMPENASVHGGLLGAAINGGEVYAHLARDVQQGTYSTPDFEHALHNARLIEAVRRAGERGERQRLTN